MRIAKTPPPFLDCGGIFDSSSQESKPTNQEGELWSQQQDMLTILRDRLCTLAPGGDGLRETFTTLAGKLQVTDWHSVWRFCDAIDSLGVEYKRCSVVLGGWHHQGDITKLTRPPDELLSQLRNYRMLMNADFWARSLLEAKPEDVMDATVALAVQLHEAFRPFPVDSWKRPKALLDAIAPKQEQLKLSIETQFLFLKQRVFVFSPTSENPTGGWSDFASFVYAYRRLELQFVTRFDKYFWGIYHHKESPEGKPSGVGK